MKTIYTHKLDNGFVDIIIKKETNKTIAYADMRIAQNNETGLFFEYISQSSLTNLKFLLEEKIARLVPFGTVDGSTIR